MASSSTNFAGKVRAVARIRSFRDDELIADSKSMITVRKSDSELPSGKFTVSFGDQTTCIKDAFEVDQCYEQNEDTVTIFSKEIKPHVSRVFDGESATYFAFGARGSGKTYTIQGSKENLGLGMLAMDEVLKIAEERRQTVAVSFYEVFQDHVYDLLDSQRPEVHVLEDGKGKRTLKGLSKVTVKSMLEFQKLYCSDSSLIKPTQKAALEPPRRSHKALMIHILASEENSTSKLGGKMNFVDLAGYENARRNSVDGTNFLEAARINKSLNALFNVIHALNANESRVPFRESILTRVLQDSLGGNNHILMLICLNPSFCLDTNHVISLVSRLKNVKPTVVCCSGKKQTSLRLPSSANKAKPVATLCSSSTTKNQTSSRLPSSAKKANSLLRGRKLFGDEDQSHSSKQAKNSSKIVKSGIPERDSAVVHSSLKEKNCPSNSALVKPDIAHQASVVVPYSHEEEIPVSDVVLEMQSLAMKKEDPLPNEESNGIQVPLTISGDNMGKENNSLLINEGCSPPLSVRIKELSNNLKSLCTPTHISIHKPQDNGSQVSGFVDNMEQKTPVVDNMNPNGKKDFSNFKSPSCVFGERSSGMKQTLVQDYLQFLNSASKEDLKGLKGIGEKRATYILECREESPEPFKTLDDLQEIGLSAKQVKRMMKEVAGELFD